MTRALVLLALVLAAGHAAAANRLADHPSPYLRLHGQDPVDWRPWGPEALAEARDQGRLLFVSVGYFACHWCHVMQRESYSDPQVAERLNRLVPIKVDRELRPALDARLIAFVERTQGQAGWPLNVVLTPDGHPLYGFTYLPRDRFLTVLEELATLWETDRERLEALATRAARELAARPGPEPQPLTAQRLTALRTALLRQARALGDEMAGGFGTQNKFPHAPQLLTLLDLAGEAEWLPGFLVTTLDAMAREGLRDALGGGFFRYTTDPNWQRPHFEKMLYDNALLARVYLRAAEVLERPDYRGVALDTLDFLRRDMRAERGGFVASLSALDVDGVEGGYYLWRTEQLDALLSAEQLAVARLALGLTGSPLTPDGHLPTRAKTIAEVAADLDLPPADVSDRLTQARARLLEARAERRLPRDDKVLAGWNGLVLTALADAARLAPHGRHAIAAADLRAALVEALWDGQRLRRAVAGGEPVGESTLEDYAYLAQGLAAWSAVNPDPEAAAADRALAIRLAALAWERFWTDGGWRLAEATLLPDAPPEPVVADGPLPSPSATLVAVSLALEDPDLRERAEHALSLGHDLLTRSPLWHTTQIHAALAH